MAGAASSEEVANALGRAMPEGRLTRLPRHPRRRDIVLAVLKADVDHVTCRRYLVDLGFVKRDRAGRRYFVNFPKVEATVAADGIDDIRGIVADVMALRR